MTLGTPVHPTFNQLVTLSTARLDGPPTHGSRQATATLIESKALATEEGPEIVKHVSLTILPTQTI